MKLCENHWGELKKAIDERGLTNFISPSPEAATKRMAAEIQGTARPETFDPLLYANNAIWNNALNVAGLEVMTPNEDGSERCPVCFLLETCPCKKEDCSYKRWVEYAANDALEATKVQRGTE